MSQARRQWAIIDEVTGESVSRPNKSTAMATLTMLLAEHGDGVEFSCSERARTITIRRSARG